MNESLGKSWSRADFHHTQGLKENRDVPHCGVDYIGSWMACFLDSRRF